MRVVVHVRRLRTLPGLIFQLERVQCGKARCRCRSISPDNWHGPYWYSYQWKKRKRGKGGRWVSKYVGRELPGGEAAGVGLPTVATLMRPATPRKQPA